MIPILMLASLLFACDRPVERPSFLEREADLYVPDLEVGHLHRPNARRSCPWPEHPDGSFDIVTNNLGFREDEDTLPRALPGRKRILVVGDSHVDGVVWNRESFPNLLEDRWDGVEVINGGTGYYGPRQYAAFINHFSWLKPDLVLVVIYVGNDFLEALHDLEKEGKIRLSRDADHGERLVRARDLVGEEVSQALDQTLILVRNPNAREVALQETIAAMERAREVCSGKGLAVALLPSRGEVEPLPRRAEVARILGIGVEDLGIPSILRRELGTRLEEDGFPVLDLAPALQGQGFYWDRDHHLSVRGHATVADALMNWLSSRMNALSGQGVDGVRADLNHTLGAKGDPFIVGK